MPLDFAAERAALEQELERSQQQLQIWSMRNQKAAGALEWLNRLVAQQATEAAAADAGTAPAAVAVDHAADAPAARRKKG